MKTSTLTLEVDNRDLDYDQPLQLPPKVTIPSWEAEARAAGEAAYKAALQAKAEAHAAAVAEYATHKQALQDAIDAARAKFDARFPDGDPARLGRFQKVKRKSWWVRT